MISKTLLILFLLNRLFSVIISAANVTSTLYYDLLGVKYDATNEDIRSKCTSLLQYVWVEKFFEWTNHDARRLCGIVQNVCNILTAPQQRLEYDENGPSISFTIFEFVRIMADEHLISTLASEQDDECCCLTTDVYILMENAHIKNEIGIFFDCLRKLQASRFASYINSHPEPPPTQIKSVSAIFQISNLLKHYPLPDSELSLKEFIRFLDGIIRKYGPYIEARDRKYTVYDRIVSLRRHLNDPIKFMTTFADELSPECYYMLYRADPFEATKDLLTPSHPVLKPVTAMSTEISEIQDLNDEVQVPYEEDLSIFFETKLKEAFA